MADSLEGLRRPMSKERKEPPFAEAMEEEDESCPTFGYLRGGRERAISVSFRLGDGTVMTLPYSWLGPCRYHPSTGITLLFAGGDLFLVMLRGRNLDVVLDTGVSLYERGLVRHRIVWVRELSGAEARTLPAGSCVVEHIAVRGVTPGEAATTLGLRSGGSAS